MNSNEERTKLEMEALEDWIDETERKLYNNASKDNSRRLSYIFTEEFVDLVQKQKADYEVKGFMKKRVQDAMDLTPAKKPFTTAKFGTLREKNNTLMNLLLTLETKQKMKKEAEKEKAENEERIRLEADLKEKQRKEDERLEAEKRAIERMEAERLERELESSLSDFDPKIVLDVHGNPIKLSDTRRNALAEGMCWLSSYDRDEDQDRVEKSWRVRI